MRRAARWLGWTLAVLAGLPLATLLVVMLLANIGPGRKLIESTVGSLSGDKVQLQGIGGRFPDQLRLEHLRLVDHVGEWLQVDGARLDWSPLALLDLRVSVQDIGADRVAVARAPDYPPKHPPKPNQGPGFWRHLHFDLQQLLISRLELGAPLTGEPVTARIQAVGRMISLEQLNVRFDAQRLDNVPSVYHVLATMQGTQLTAQLDLEEGAGGPLSRLTNLRELGTTQLHASLLGPLNALQTDLDAKTAVGKVSVHGQLDVPGRAANVDVDVDATAMAPRSWMQWQRIVLHGQARGTLTDPKTTAHLDAQGLKFGPVILASTTADYHGESGAIAVTTTVNGLQLPSPVHDTMGKSPLMAEAHLRFGGGQPLRIEGTVRHALLQARGSYTFDRDRLGSFTASLPDLAPLMHMVGLTLSGSGEVQGQVRAVAHTERMALTSNLNITGGAALLAPLLRPRAQVSTSLIIGDPQGVILEDAQIRSASVMARGQGRAGGAGLDIRYKLSSSDLSQLAPTLSGSLDAQGRVSGVVPRLDITADASARLSEDGSPPGPIDLALQLHGVPERPSLRLDVHGELDSAPLQLAINAQRDTSGPIQVQIERGSWKSLRASGALDIGSDGRSPHGQLQLQVGQLQDVGHLLHQPLQGSLDAQVNAVSIKGEPGVHVAVTATQFGVPAQQLQQLTVQGQITDLMRTPIVALDVAARAVRKDVQAQIALQARGRVDQLRLHLNGQASQPDLPPLKLDTSAVWLNAQRSLRLNTLSLTLDTEQLHLLAPSTVGFDGGLKVDDLRLGIGDATLRAQGRVLPSLDLQASLRNLTPQLVRAIVPALDADGKLNADAKLQGELAHPTGTINLDATQFRALSGALRGLPTLDLHAQAQLNGQSAQLQVKLDAGNELQLQVSGQMPFARTAAIDLKLEGHGNLAAANSVLEANGQRALGQMRIDATLAGTMAAPKPHGTVTLNNADFQDFPRGVHWTAINANAEGDGDQLTLKQFTARAGPGTLTASGNIAFNSNGDMPANLKLTAHDAQPLASDLLTANLDADLTVSGSLSKAWTDASTLTAAGRVHINHAEINVPNALPPNVAVLDVVRPGQKPQGPASAHALRLHSDITIDAPRAVFVRGRGLNAELGGSLHVGGVSTEPAISGAFDMRNGTFALGGTTLTFSSGTVSFNGSGIRHRIDPTLDFVANNVTSVSKQTLEITGYADAPVIKLTSTPEMPQDQILSQLLFGENITQLSALQIAQIGTALATMSGLGGGGGGFNPINSIQRRLGLDRLAISGAGSSGGTTTGAATSSAASQSNVGATIEAGRYVSSRVFLGAKQSTTGVTQGEVQVDLTKHLKVQGVVGTGNAASVQGATPQNDPGSSIGFSYQLQY